MTLDDNAAAYGLFQLVFANLVQQFATAVFYIQRNQNPGLHFNEVFRRDFSRLRDILKDELKQFEANSFHDMEVQDIRNACAKAATLAEWRNPRVHARVQIDANGIAIYDKVTLKRLAIDRDDCLEKIRQAIGIQMNLDQAVGQLLRNVQSQQQITAMLDEIFKTVENQNA